ncbi:minor capsid protein [Gryllotalpicola koreensis]|uniref:HK97 gp10 family phage protein n=1 Tax=Gryllotalpicola koreensis TaxID=993086 RepID=A0ABP8A1V8_9MICO
MEWDFSGFHLEEAAAEILARIDPAIMAGLQVIRAKAEPTVPLGPDNGGHLRSSAELTVTSHEGHIRYPGPYARYQEYGVFYRHGVFGAPLKYTTPGTGPFYLTGAMISGREAALAAVAGVLFG